MNTAVLFPSPEPVRRKHRIFPVFLPFSGCPRRCVFCAQDIQTGLPEMSIPHALKRASLDMEALFARYEEVRSLGPQDSHEGQESGHAPKNKLSPLELAFFGGTFTMLPRNDFLACLRFAAHWRARGLVSDLRCSTRPDAVNPAVLHDLKAAGFSCVELGVQSFSDKALAASRRGYNREQARRACAMIRESGLALGIQLLPGMPGHSREAAFEDVRQSVRFLPACVRLYPCLVLEGTGLASQWRAGAYSPWDFESTVDFLARACCEFRSAGIAVIRMGLAEEPGLADKVLAGPRHPAIGGMARSRALYYYIRDRLETLVSQGEIVLPGSPESGLMVLYVPRRFQGEFWGHGGELAAQYSAMGLKRGRVIWWDNDFFELKYYGPPKTGVLVCETAERYSENGRE